MKDTHLVLALVLGLVSIYAQANDFEGVNVGLGLGYSQPQIQYTDNNPAGKYLWSKNNIIYRFDASYNLALNEKWLLGFGATYDSFLHAGTQDKTYGPVTGYIKDHRSIYLQPTYVLDNSSAVFAKVGYHEARVNTLGKPTASWVDDKFNVYGTGYGLGYKRLLNERFFAQAEVQFVGYGNKSMGGGSWHYKQKTTDLIFTAGYKF